MALKTQEIKKRIRYVPDLPEGHAFRCTEMVSVSGQYLEKNWAVRAGSVRVIHNYVSGTSATNFVENLKDSAQKLRLLSPCPCPSPLFVLCQKLNAPHLPVSWRMEKTQLNKSRSMSFHLSSLNQTSAQDRRLNHAQGSVPTSWCVVYHSPALKQDTGVHLK